jgi:all-trans-8'-apo-beta-carotenal 15,15'-oxygenase
MDGGHEFRVGLRSLEREVIAPARLPIVGQVPADLRGTLYRVGPSRWDVFGDRLRHWFDGDGMIHALTLDAGGATYRCRFVQQTAHVEEDRARRRLYGSFGTSPPGGRLRRLFRRKQRRNPANTHVVAHAGGLFALCEAGRPWRVDADDLSTLGEETLGGLLATPLATFAAHPRRDPASGELWGFGTEQGRVPKLHLYRWPERGAASKVASVALPMPAMIHDFGLTPRSAVVVATPVVTPRVPLGLMLGQSSYGENLRYRPELGAQIGVVDRRTGAARWFETDPFLGFHVVNAYDEHETVVVDVCAYASEDLLRVFYEMMGEGPLRRVAGSLRRLVIDRRTGTVRWEVLLGRSFEFPRIGEAWSGRPYTRAFGLTWEGSDIPGRPAVFEVESRRLITAPLPAGAWAGELVPVVKVGARDEGDVWLLSVVLDAREAASELQIFDGRDLEAGPVARARLPHVMPLGFHGSWVPA